MSKTNLSPLSLLVFLFAGLLPCLASGVELNPAAWRSLLYPENWTPPDDKSFSSDKLIQDFSYAGYRRGENPVPHVAGSVFNVTQPPFAADSSGQLDATAAIQAAINAAAAAGGGVVYLPAGTYHVAPQGSARSALSIRSSRVVLRGAGKEQTFILNTSSNMRNRFVIEVTSTVTFGEDILLTEDLDTPTRRIPVGKDHAALFKAEDKVRMMWDFTSGWVAEHGQETWWGAGKPAPSPARYHREVSAVNVIDGWIELDVPTRYTMRTRDVARIQIMRGNLSGVGLEDFSIGNVQHPGSGFGGGDYTNEGTAGYDAHASQLIAITNAFDSWIKGVHSFQAVGNSHTSHMLSNGIRLLNCFRITLDDCAMRRPQYGGGGGNGYMFRIQSSQEILVKNSIAEFSRHGFVLSHAGASGNVFLNCLDKETDRATGDSGIDGYVTGGAGSDHHMHFSHSNLFDLCRAVDSYYIAHHRGDVGGSTTSAAHGLTSAHGVYWNTHGSGSRGGAVVRSSQGRHGYVIGTSGENASVSLIGGAGHGPPDHLEGEGRGTTLLPQSLYADQLGRRLGPNFSLAPDHVLNHPANTLKIPAQTFTLAGASTTTEVAVAWSASPGVVLSPLQNGALDVRVPGSGLWRLRAELTADGFSRVRAITILAQPGVQFMPLSVSPVADTFIRGDSSTANTNNGTSTLVSIKRASSANTTRHGLLRFDLSGLDLGEGTLETARLVMSRSGSAAYDGWVVAVRAVQPSPAWTETGVTWNNAPAFGTTFATYEPSPVMVDAIDITAAILAAKTAGADSIDLGLFVVSQPGDSVLSYHSREQAQANLRPRLEFEMLPSIHRFETWISRQPGVEADQRAALADPDGDGLSNLLEMALGRAPGSHDSRQPLAWFDGSLHFTCEQTGPAFTRLHLDQSTDLVSWEPLGLSPEHIESAEAGLLRVTRPVALDTSARFWRLRLAPE
jgi:hypothetical protein